MIEVLLIQTDNRIDGIKRVIAYFKEKFDSFQDKKVIIKPNFNTADPAPASTDITIIKEILIKLKTPVKFQLLNVLVQQILMKPWKNWDYLTYKMRLEGSM